MNGPWCYSEADVSALLARAEAAEARVAVLEIELKISIGGCDANNGDSHTPISLDAGKYYFCQACGETMTKAEVKRHSSAAAIRKGPTP